MKKITALLLAVVMTVCLLAACGSKPQDAPEPSGTPGSGDTGTPAAPDAQPSTDEPGEVKKIILTYATPGVEAPDMLEVQEALNEMTRRDIGVEVEFMPISIFELGSTVPTKVIAGEQIDVFMMAFTGTKIYEQMNLLMPLNEYITTENAPYISTHTGPDGTDIDMDGTVLSVKLPVNEPVCGGFLVSKDDLAAAGLADKYHDYDMVTLDDLDDIFAGIKAVYPDKYPCGIFGSATRADMTFIFDELGDSRNSGVVIGLDGTKVENMYASEPYKEYLEHVRQWYLNGYVPKDAATTDISITDYLSQGVISGYFNAFKDSSLKETMGKEFVFLLLKDYYHASFAPASLTYFGVPVTAEEPEAAVRFIDYMMGSKEVANLLTFGIEGKHWVPYPDNADAITYPDGVTRETTGYPYGYGFYCNRTLDGAYLEFGATDPTVLPIPETIKRAENRYTKGYGVVYDSAEWITQLQQIDTVVAQYRAALECGSADLDTVYPEFLAALDANGMAEVVAAKDAWFQKYLKNN